MQLWKHFKIFTVDPLSKKKKLNDRVNTRFASDFMGVYYIYKSFLLEGCITNIKEYEFKHSRGISMIP